MKIIVLGEVLWDNLGNREHLGGAPLNFAVNAKRLGHDVSFVTGIGRDPRGDQVLEKLGSFGLTSEFVTRVPDQPTGTVTVSLGDTGQPEYLIHRPAAYDFPALDSAQFDWLVSSRADWIYYGTLQQLSPVAHDVLLRVVAASPSSRRFYDVNLRDKSYNSELVCELVQHSSAIKLNEEEAAQVSEMLGIKASSLESFCRECRDRFDLGAVCVTRGAEGCALLSGEYVENPGYQVAVADTIGAGDAFSAGLLHGLNAGWPMTQVADFANRLGALAASRQGGTPGWSLNEVYALDRARPSH